MILVASDLHAHDWPRFATVGPDGVNSRFAALLNVLDQIAAYARQYQPSAIVLARDLFHRKYFVRFPIFTPVLERLHALQACAPLTVLVGNHDYESHGWWKASSTSTALTARCRTGPGSLHRGLRASPCLPGRSAFRRVGHGER